jgi:integrase
MKLKYQEDGCTLNDLNALLSGNFLFNPDTPVSRKSRYGDKEWDWTDEENDRLKATSNSSIRFSWEKVTIGSEACLNAALRNNQKFIPMLTEEILEDIRRGIFIFSMFPTLIKFTGKHSTEGNKAITIAQHIRAAVNFFSHIYLESKLQSGISHIRKLSDITLADIRNAIETYPYWLEEVKTVLYVFGSEVVNKNLKYGSLQWNYLDIKNLRWPPIRDSQPIKSFPDPLFRLISNKSCDLVGEFLTLLGIKLQDSKAGIKNIEARRQQWPRFREMFDSYIDRRNIIRTKGAGYASTHSTSYIEEFGSWPKEMLDFLFDVQCAAENIILLYTGMRYSEAAMIRTNCLIERGKICLIKSTINKGRRTNLPIDDDEWVAIDIVQDAIHALEQLSRCTFNNFLFSNFDTVKNGEIETPLSNRGFHQRMNKYLKRIDIDKQWTDWILSSHQYRQSLVYQLARAEVGLPYITRQLHHFHSRFHEASNRINPASTVYGMQKERLVGNVTGLNALKDTNNEILQSLYGEGHKFAGGGAALHVERTEGFFKGLGLEGEEREAYITEMAESGVALMRMGVGWCVRNHTKPPVLNEIQPPCIGDLNCNPHTCKYSVVPESRKSDVINRYLNALKMLNTPDQAHLKSHWEAERDAFAAMLQQLGIDPESLESAKA